MKIHCCPTCGSNDPSATLIPLEDGARKIKIVLDEEWCIDEFHDLDND